MKRNELEIGKVYAYSTYTFTPTRAYEIKPVVIHDTELNKFHKGEVQVKSIDKDGNIGETPYWVNTRKIVGKYQETLHEFQLAEKNAEINRLKKEIRERENRDTIERLVPEWKDYGVSRWDIHLDGTDQVKVTIKLDQLKAVTDILRWYPLTAQRLEEVRAELDAIKNPPQEEVAA